VSLEPGDWLVAFTDGVIEAENATQLQYGEERLAVMLRWGAQMQPAVLLEQLFADVDRFVANAPQHDDITCLLMKCSA
jgi:phosphoserine phosphatase RsbU/P